MYNLSCQPKICDICGKSLPIPRHNTMKRHPECRKQIWKIRQQQYRKGHKEEMKAHQHECLKRRKLEILDAYGGKCACCGEWRHEFLTIDHIDGGGNAHRKALGVKGGTAFYSWLRKQGYPTGYRVLCHNCNFSLGCYGYCPHKEAL